MKTNLPVKKDPTVILLPSCQIHLTMTMDTSVTTEQRCQILTEMIQKETSEFIPFLGTFRVEDLLCWIEQELGDRQILDVFRPRGTDSSPLYSQAIPTKNILHIVSGNTPHGALQSIFRGLIIGSHNFIKLPSTGLTEVDRFYRALPDSLRDKLEISTTVQEHWWEQAEVVIATGSDSSIAAIHAKLLPHQRFIAHGHKVSFALLESPSREAARLAARDIAAFDQNGCLSPHAMYLLEGAEEFAALLAEEMDILEQTNPRGDLSLSEHGAISNLREVCRYRAANAKDTRLWESSGSTAWSVIYESDSKLKLSCLNRTIYVKPWPQPTQSTQPTQLIEALGDEIHHLSTVALHPLNKTTLRAVEALSPSRICALGKMQSPSLFWHHDGHPTLSNLVRWRDIESSDCTFLSFSK